MRASAPREGAGANAEGLCLTALGCPFIFIFKPWRWLPKGEQPQDGSPDAPK